MEHNFYSIENTCRQNIKRYTSEGKEVNLGTWWLCPVTESWNIAELDFKSQQTEHLYTMYTRQVSGDQILNLEYQ